MALPHVFLLAIAAILTFQYSLIQHALAQGVNPRSAAVYLPAPHHRLLLIGGSNDSGSGSKTVSSIDLSSEIVDGRPRIESLNVDLPESLKYPIAAVTVNKVNPADAIPRSLFTVMTFGGITVDGRLSKAIYSFPFPSESKPIRPTIRQPSIDVCLSSHHGVAMAHANSESSAQEVANNGPITSARDRNVYLFGGIRSVDYKTSDNLIVFDPVERTHAVAKFAINSPVPPPRHLGSLIRLDDNRLLLTGGTFNVSDDSSSGGWGQHQDVWLYDTNGSCWAQYPHSLSTGRSQHASLVYTSSSGTRFVIVLGGQAGVPLIEYADVSNSGPWKQSVIGPGTNASLNGVRNLIEPHVLLLGDQIVVLGAVLDDPANILTFGVVKIREEESGSLSFAWSDKFTPLPDLGLSSTILGLNVWVFTSVVAGLAILVVAACIALLIRFRCRSTFNKIPTGNESQHSDEHPTLDTLSFGVAEQALTGQPTTIERVRSPFLLEGVSSESVPDGSHSPFHVAPTFASPASPTNSSMYACRAWSSTSASKAARASPLSPVLDSSIRRLPFVHSSMAPRPTLLHPADVRRVQSAEPRGHCANTSPTKPDARASPRFATLALPSSPLPRKRSATFNSVTPPNTRTPPDRIASLQIKVPQPQDIRRVPSLQDPHVAPLSKVAGDGGSCAPAAAPLALAPSAVDASSRWEQDQGYEIALPASSIERSPFNPVAEREGREAGRGNGLEHQESELCLPTSPLPIAGSLSPLSSSQEIH